MSLFKESLKSKKKKKTLFPYTQFQCCFWKDDTVSLQGKAYRWIGGKWIEIFPKVHLATLHLAQRFFDIEEAR